jgi:hypothetical protein
MSRKGKQAREDTIQQHLREIEGEYDVEIEWSYRQKGEIDGRNRSTVTATAIPLAWSWLPRGSWAVSGEVIQTALGASEMRAHLEVLCRLCLDLQMTRSFGVTESLYFIRPAA